MIRGTTPVHTYEVDLDTDLIKAVKVLYSQADEQIVCKRTEQCELSGNTIATRLTQEDTFKFDSRKTVQIQIRVLTTAGEALTSDVITTTVTKCLDNEVMV